eukprot:NODE_454_length_8261_cov_0.201054.p3 type:complete len:405 gc:universal NODE_454_length_8261_cov_0.201054:5322-4108(-)
MISGQESRKITSTVRKERDNALVRLFADLDKSKSYSESEWKDFFDVIFYHFWLSDKQYVQHNLADMLSEQLLVESDFAFDYLKYFWIYMAGRWHGLDSYRLDKYYDLFRRMHLVTFKLLHLRGNETLVFNKIMSILRGDLGPLGNDNLDLPDGIRFHTLEVFLDEFCKSCSENEELDTFPLTLLNSESLFSLIFPILEMFKNTKNTGVRSRITNEVLLKLLHLLMDIDHEKAADAKQFFVNVVYSYPTHSNLSDDKRQELFNIVKKTLLVPQFIQFSSNLALANSIPELVEESNAESIVQEYDMDLQTSSEPRVLCGKKLDVVKELRTLWRVSPKSNCKAESDTFFPIDADIITVPKANYEIPKLTTLHKCKHSKSVHFKLDKNRIKRFHKRQPPSYLSKGTVN